MNEQEKNLLVIAHALAYQENEIHYLKALLLEKTNIKLEEFQREQNEFWTKSKNFRIYETLHNLQNLRKDIDSLPNQLDLDMYMDHLRWPSDPPEEKM